MTDPARLTSSQGGVASNAGVLAKGAGQVDTGHLVLDALRTWDESGRAGAR